MTDFAPPRTLKNGVVAYGDEDKWVVEFYNRPIHMEALSEQYGQPIYQDRIFCKKMRGGDTKTVWDTTATGIEYDAEGNWATIDQTVDGTEADWMRFPKAWAVFEKKSDKAVTGTPVEEWGAVSRSFAETLKAQNIRTVEQLALLSDAQAEGFMGGRKFREMAKAFLDSAHATAVISRNDKEKADLQAELDILRKQVKELAANQRRTKDAA
jgi:hypothetical protein